ncbi:hypothetical protein JCM11251_003865 [Rhodosporidiobolus azoricus]
MASFDPTDLFPRAASTSRAALTLHTSSIALFGPLPTSSLLHIALNHLRDDNNKVRCTERLSEKTKGKKREVDEEDAFPAEDDEIPLPRPINGKARRVLVLTPDSTVLRDELSKEGDVSLFGARRSSETARLLDLVDIRTLPTSAHLTYFLSTCYTPTTPSAEDAHSAFLATKSHIKVDPSYLSYEPTMVVIHAPSDYLEEPANVGAGVEAYGSILAHFISTFHSLTSPPPFLVLHDPLASIHSLPTLPLRLAPKKPKKRTFSAAEHGEGEEGEKEEKEDPDRVPLRRIAERLFDWVGEAKEVPTERDYSAPPRTHYVLNLGASPFFLFPSKLETRKAELEYTVVEVGEDDPDGEEGGVRIEVLR